MKRRDFLKNSVGAGLLTGAAISVSPFKKVLSAPVPARGDYDLVALLGGEPNAMFDRGIEELGGMRKYVKRGQTVVVKPNIAWDSPPERGANTDPNLVKRVVEHCFNAGAKEVFVFDHTCDEWTRSYRNSGIEAAAKEAGANVVNGNNERNYRDVKIENGISLREAKVHELILNSDVFINIPVLKHHGGANITITMKNLMGIVWDRRYWHRNNLHQCIADFASFRKPDLNIVDAYRVMKRNGPRGVSVEDVILKKGQIISADMVAADTASCRLYGIEPSTVDYIKIAEKAGIGTSDLDSLKISRISI